MSAVGEGRDRGGGRELGMDVIDGVVVPVVDLNLGRAV